MAEDEALELRKQFIREMTQLIEQGGREIARALANLGTELREEPRLHRAEMRGLQEDMRDLRAESRGQTSALLRMLDRLDNGGAAAAGP